jgi:hypothetical protein
MARGQVGASKKWCRLQSSRCCPSGEIGRHKGLKQFEPSGGNVRSEARQSRRKPWMFRRPSQRRAKPRHQRQGRCREQTAGTYGRRAMVKACSRPRTAHALAAKAEVVRKSLDFAVVPVRFRPRAPTQSTSLGEPLSAFGGCLCAAGFLNPRSRAMNAASMCGISTSASVASP